MDIKERLHSIGQTHLIDYYDRMDDIAKNKFIDQINSFNFNNIDKALSHLCSKKFGKVEPIDVLSLSERKNKSQEFIEKGLKAIQSSKLALVLLAGGMGTRLETEEPKGMFNIGIHKDLYIFECIINNILNVVKLSGNWIDLYIMTSVLNHDKTVDFFEQNNYFGYNKETIFFYKQSMTPVTDFNGKVLMKNKSEILTSPNGNGGWYFSLLKSSYSNLVKNKHYEWLNVFAVDNVLQNVADPDFLGAIISGGFNAGAKVIKKIEPNEKVGIMCLEDGRPSVIEYYELTEELKMKKDEHGNYLYNYGTILNYIFSVNILNKIIDKELPYHVVKKKSKYMDVNGDLIMSNSENCYKYETLVLDMVRLMENCLLFEVERNKEFAPIKNLLGNDSVETARKLLMENHIDF